MTTMATLNPSLLSLVAIALGVLSISDGKVMMEYIGATGIPITFSDVPIDPQIDFHFILSFAIDASPAGDPQNGVFSPYWVTNLDPSSVRSIKAQHPNVKVMLSLSGWSLNSKVLQWYNPSDPESWVSNAVDSLRTLITNYNLDGIDIDYEVFPRNDTSFTYCIGELITRLKMEDVISVATIAPYYKTASFYQKLYGTYSKVIDYVNHQFYTDRVGSVRAYVRAFEMRAKQFGAEKLLPSYEVDGRGIQGDGFFEALGMIESLGFEVNGVMIFSADGSKAGGFYYERKAQAFLINGNATN